VQVATSFRLDFIWLTADLLDKENAMANVVKDAMTAGAMQTMCIRSETGACAGQRKMASSHGDG
jgi:hypothetical protein